MGDFGDCSGVRGMLFCFGVLGLWLVDLRGFGFAGFPEECRGVPSVGGV